MTTNTVQQATVRVITDALPQHVRIYEVHTGATPQYLTDDIVVEDVESLLALMKAELGDDLDIVQAPTMMPWGNMSVLIRDPEGSLINLYTPVTPQALHLQQIRTPKMPDAGRAARS